MEKEQGKGERKGEGKGIETNNLSTDLQRAKEIKIIGQRKLQPQETLVLSFLLNVGHRTQNVFPVKHLSN